jgi:hypothetical protein
MVRRKDVNANGNGNVYVNVDAVVPPKGKPVLTVVE